MKSNSSNIEHPQQAPVVPEAATQLTYEASPQRQPASVRPTRQIVAQTPGAVMTNPSTSPGQDQAENPVGTPGHEAESPEQLDVTEPELNPKEQIADAIDILGIDINDIVVEKLVENGRGVHEALLQIIRLMAIWCGRRPQPLQSLPTEDLCRIARELSTKLSKELPDNMGARLDFFLTVTEGWDSGRRGLMCQLACGAEVQLSDLVCSASQLRSAMNCLEGFRKGLFAMQRAARVE